MECELYYKIEDYHDGELDEVEIRKVEEHLKNCSLCQLHLSEVAEKDKYISQLKAIQPQLSDSVQFRYEVLSLIDGRKSSILDNRIKQLLNYVSLLLLRPAAKIAIISAAVFVVGLFIYQHYVLVEKIDSLSQRMENNLKIESNPQQNRERIDFLSKFQNSQLNKIEDVDELFDAYQLLQIRHVILVKTLKKDYPEVYEDLLEILNEEPSMATEKISL